MEDEIIIKILIKLGVQKNVILNPVSYELLKDKIICLMKQFKILKQPMEELIEENEILDNLERNRVELINVDEAVSMVYFSDMSDRNLNSFIRFVKSKDERIKDKNQFISIKTDQDRVVINEKFFNSKEKTIISNGDLKNEIYIGKRTLYSTKNNEKTENKDDMMETQLMIYNRDGNPVQGEKALYYTHKRVPREKYILNEKTGEFERVRISRRVKNNRVGTNINGARKNKSIKSINLKRIILRTINKYKANKKISEHDFDR